MARLTSRDMACAACWRAQAQRRGVFAGTLSAAPCRAAAQGRDVLAVSQAFEPCAGILQQGHQITRRTAPFATGGMQCRDALVQLRQPSFVGLAIADVLPQGPRRLVDLDLRIGQRVEDAAQSRIVGAQRLEACLQACQPRLQCLLALVQGVQRRARALEKRGTMGQAFLFQADALPLARQRGQRPELLHLLAQLLGLGRALRAGRQRLVVGARRAAPRGMRGGHRLRGRLQAAVHVEQLLLGRRPQQQLVFVLAVHVEQLLAQGAQLRLRRPALPLMKQRLRAVLSSVRRISTLAPAAASASVPASKPFCSSQSRSAAGPLNSAATSARVAPSRTASAWVRSPSTNCSASMRMDLPAPVSPVSTVKPPANSSSSRSTMTKSRIDSASSIGGQARPCGSLDITFQCSFWRNVAK